MREHRRKAREWEAENDQLSQFSATLLRKRLVGSVPLQKLYEKVFFDQFDLKAACAKYDNFGDDTLTQDNFVIVVLTNVPSLSTLEAQALTTVVPRL